MDRILIEDKLESLHRCVQRIEAKRPENANVLAQDWDRQDIIALNLTRAVQLCVDVAAHIIASKGGRPPDTMAEAFDRLASESIIPGKLAQRLKGAVGFRNIAIHQYQDVNWDIVHSIIHTRLVDFKRFAQVVLNETDP